MEKIIAAAAATKFEMFMGHKIRARLQDQRINEIFECVKNGETGERIFVFLDFKMKVEPERFRETKLQFYGKSGMNWHGSAVFYKPKKRKVGTMRRE